MEYLKLLYSIMQNDYFITNQDCSIKEVHSKLLNLKKLQNRKYNKLLELSSATKAQFCFSMNFFILYKIATFIITFQ